MIGRWQRHIKPGYVKLMLTILYRKNELHEKFQDLKNFELLKTLWYKYSTIFDWVCVVLQEVQKGTTLQLLRIDFRSSDLMVRALYSQCRCPKWLVGSKIYFVFHPPKVNELSTRNSWGLVVKSKLSPCSVFVAFRQLNPVLNSWTLSIKKDCKVFVLQLRKVANLLIHHRQLKTLPSFT